MYYHDRIKNRSTSCLICHWNFTVLLILFCFLTSHRCAAQTEKADQANIEVVQVPTDVGHLNDDSASSASLNQHFELDNDHTSLLFAVSHAGLSYTYGRFDQCRGQVLISPNQDESYFRFEVDVASISTNNRLRDDHLRGSDFFAAKTFPKITFNSTNVMRDRQSQKYNVTGKLSMHGQQREIEMPFTLIGVGKGPMGKTRGGFLTKFTLQRSEFGIDSMAKVIGDQIAVTFSFEGIVKDAVEKEFNRFTNKKSNFNP